MRLVLTEDAQNDVNSAYQWYETESNGLGSEFLDQIDKVLERVRRNPEQFPRLHEETRRAIVRRFPYVLYYRIEQSGVVVVGCFHARRHPRFWQAR